MTMIILSLSLSLFFCGVPAVRLVLAVYFLCCCYFFAVVVEAVWGVGVGVGIYGDVYYILLYNNQRTAFVV